MFMLFVLQHRATSSGYMTSNRGMGGWLKATCHGVWSHIFARRNWVKLCKTATGIGDFGLYLNRMRGNYKVNKIKLQSW